LGTGSAEEETIREDEGTVLGASRFNSHPASPGGFKINSIPAWISRRLWEFEAGKLIVRLGLVDFGLHCEELMSLWFVFDWIPIRQEWLWFGPD